LLANAMATAPATQAANDSWDFGRLGPYRVIGSIAIGGMGVVLRAQDIRDGRMVALKTTRSKRPSEVAGIRREISVLKEISHPAIVRLIADGTSGGLPWMAMELLPGQTLSEMVATLWRKTPSRPAGAAPAPRPRAGAGRLREVVKIAAQVGRALDCLHSRGLVHRDVKPSNIMVGNDGRVTLFDFGLACPSRGDAAAAGAAEVCPGVGTLEYAAPEQMRGEAVDARADIYALGCVLYELVTGRRPKDAGVESSVTEQPDRSAPPVDPPAPSTLVSGVPRDLETMLVWMLAQRREDRLGSVREIVEMLEIIVGQLFEAPEDRMGALEMQNLSVFDNRAFLIANLAAGRAPGPDKDVAAARRPITEILGDSDDGDSR
jgi:serine/threonine protein kinase